MSKTKNPLFKLILIVVILFIAGFVIVLMITPRSHNPVPVVKKHTANDVASGDTPLETLKTLTATVNKVESQNQSLIKENQQLKTENDAKFSALKKSLLDQFNDQANTLKQNNAAAHDSIQHVIDNLENKKNAYPVDSGNSVDNIQWIDDIEHLTSSPASMIPTSSDSLLDSTDKLNKPSTIAYFTIPVNATLTGAIAMQPLIGRIPINGQVPDPYHFKVIIGPKNLAANGIDIPPAIQGIVATGTATGDMLGDCARGSITSMTFVFSDGTISTTQAADSHSLGEIAASNGNPCIKGSFHTNAAEFLAGTTLLAGAQGYANALSQAQMETTNPNNGNPSISTIIGNSNTFAVGQAGSAAAQAAQQWWQERAKNSFDFVFVPNVDPKTHELLHLNININQQIDINYNPNGRKIAYEYPNKNTVTHQLD